MRTLMIAVGVLVASPVMAQSSSDFHQTDQSKNARGVTSTKPEPQDAWVKCMLGSAGLAKAKGISFDQAKSSAYKQCKRLRGKSPKGWEKTSDIDPWEGAEDYVISQIGSLYGQ